MSFQGKTIFITGGSRGIGKAIGLKLATAGANIVIAAKSIEENPKLGGTIFSAAEEMRAAGGNALAVQLDVRNDDQIKLAVQQAVDTFGGIDILINNASAISLTGTEKTDSKRFDLMHDINVRGTFLMTQACVPYLRKGNNPHILTLSPPLNLDPKWFSGHLAYTLSKYNMSMMTLGWAGEFRQDGIAVNSLWPRTTIDTAAVRNLLGGEALARMSRKPEILADAAYYIFQKPSSYTGQLLMDDEVLAAEGITDLSSYAVVQGGNLYTDLFMEPS
jgi:citronellol/citronellal dehydrogenase